MISIQGIKKSFHKTPVLKGIDIELNKGEVLAIIGPSGSGKSTLLRCLNWLEVPDEGIISIDDVSLDAENYKKKQIQQLIQKSTMVFQHYNLFKNKSVMENVTQGLITTKKLPKDEAYAIGEKYLDQVGLLKFKDKYPATLSGGQQQRVGIARALAMDPELLLFDEPTSALDPELVSGVLKIIKDIASMQKTMILVTHEMSFAKDVADKIIFMEDGNIIESGTTDEVFNQSHNSRTQSFINKIETEQDEEVL
ncbi:amino acid ABC transporter ATP-binding protein [Mammaliicoccus sciuri]|uniref:amino acid ABC transporter ATP-binding protein n=1 Tax=Mammaliicoccus sciuri TaxID=1296 RepID=UPI0018DC5941|nr:amino acid ABC transporter ATP-binding protein [Mammaliicoccus sciuri]QPW13502.1 amino acid ABC transporter ATP-binding protein [Mammaliicoccus sciuri]